MERHGSRVEPSSTIVGSLSSHVARLDTSNVPPDVESVKSDDNDESFFVVDRSWATLFRLSRHWKTENLNLLRKIVDLENLNVEAEARCKVLSKELEDVKAELLRVHSIAHSTILRQYPVSFHRCLLLLSFLPLHLLVLCMFFLCVGA
ncbi:hypothetical protein FRX31_018023 [Thalictrum thalictroides]|uniref:Uncharacterized protein n=1 Tax=Thalictrum thalictroides TaxID=46969 RepID=A0A7J6W780_THATH|nr:hypothetical protein FRX31_018023 [Thalictrum thalictroides]